MAASQLYVKPDTLTGVTLLPAGAIFKVWAPDAFSVHVIGDFNQHILSDANLLVKDGNGYWAGYIPGVKDRDRYMFYVRGEAGQGRKRDPFARELDLPFPGECVIRASDYPWHNSDYRTPMYHNFVIYQLHVGTFFTPHRPQRGGTFLDVAQKLPYLSDLGITAIQLLPIQEFHTQFSLGYNGTDYFSPEMDYAVPDASLQDYLTIINALFAAKGYSPLTFANLRGEMNQLKALIDLAHIYGIAVILDVVYNHAGGNWGTPNESIYFFDWQVGDNSNSLYFTNTGHAGGLVFDYSKDGVREFLIQNAKFLLDEFRIDGLRYDQVSVIDHDGQPDGWNFCQDLTDTIRFHKPESFHIAEYWPVNSWVVRTTASGGAGFSSSLTDSLRISIRKIIAEASNPDERPLAMNDLGSALWPGGFLQQWQFVQGPENHDIVLKDREQRIAKLGDPNFPRSWYGRSRARVGTGISLVAPGVPMLFMGQEFLEEKQWADDYQTHAGLLLNWDGVDSNDKQMKDHIRFVSELIRLRWKYPALRGNGFQVITSHNQNRVLAFQRWDTESGNVVVVVIHLSTFTKFNYRIGFPFVGKWKEVFNSDVYENWVNPNVYGNGGFANVANIPMHGMNYSAELVLPANSICVFSL